MWLNDFKIAIITKDVNKIDTIMDAMPQFDTLDEMEEAFYLFQQADKLLNDLKNETARTMRKIKDNISFIESTHITNAPKLDIMH